MPHPPRRSPLIGIALGGAALLAGMTLIAAVPDLPSATAATRAAQPQAARGPQHAPQERRLALPPIGAEIPVSALALDATLEYDGATLTLDFRGGMKHRVDVNPTDPFNSVRLRAVGFKLSGQSDGGTVTIEQNDVDVEARSTLTIVQSSPPKFEHRDYESFTMVIDKSDGAPVILTTKDPMVQTATLTQFPPKGDTYKLERPVELIDPANPDTVVARITRFDSKRGGL